MRRNSLRISGIPERAVEDPIQIVLTICNEALKVSPPITRNDIDRAHRVNKPDANKVRPLLVKFATYQARNRVFKLRNIVRPKNRDPRHPWQPLASAVSTALADVDGVERETGVDDGHGEGEAAPRDGDDAVPQDAGPEHGDEVSRPDELQYQQPGPSPQPPTAVPDHITVNHVKVKTAEIYFNEDLTRYRSEILFNARKSKKEKRISDCWSFDGVIRIKDNANNVHRINNTRDLTQFA